MLHKVWKQIIKGSSQVTTAMKISHYSLCPSYSHCSSSFTFALQFAEIVKAQTTKLLLCMQLNHTKPYLLNPFINNLDAGLESLPIKSADGTTLWGMELEFRGILIN